MWIYTVKPVLSGHSKRRPKLVFKTGFRLMQVKSIAECSPWSILQYFGPSLSHLLSIRFLFCLSIFEWPPKTGFTVHKNDLFPVLISVLRDKDVYLINEPCMKLYTKYSSLKRMLFIKKYVLSVSYCMVCAYEQEGNPGPCGLCPVHTHNHTIIALLHQHACALCALWYNWCRTLEYYSKVQ